MALPVFEKSYEFAVDQTFNSGSTDEEQHARILFAIKDTLVNLTAPWTVALSSDQSSAGAADYWTDWTKIKWNYLSAHSWIVLTSPGGDQLCIDCNYTSSRSDVLSLAWSSEGLFTGGTTVNRPTAVDESVFLDLEDWMGGATSVLQYQMHIVQSVDGDNTFIVIMYNAVPVMFWGFLTAQDPVDGYTLNRIAYAVPNTGTTGNTMSITGLFEQSNWRGKATASGSAVGKFSCMLDVLASCPSDNSTLNEIQQNISGANRFSNRWQLYPVGVSSLQAGLAGRHGRIADLWGINSGAANGDTIEADPLNPAYTLAKFGALIIPWTGLGPPLVS